MTKDADQIREEIRVTREDLSSNVNALTESVKPGNVAKRQADKVRGAAVSTKERVMGAAPGSPQLVRSKTQGNPLAAGLIAFGAGWLVGSLIPATEQEQQAASAVKDNVEPLRQEVTSVAKQAADNLREPAQEAVASVRQTATEAVENTRQEGTSAAQQVKGDAQDATSTVQSSRS